MKNTNKQKWLNLWERINAQGNPEPVYKDLVLRYSESHRAYHTLEHIKHCLSVLEQVKGFALDINTLEFALWYHDSVYDTKAKDNEEKSAQLAGVVAKNALLPDDFINTVSSLIMATKHLGTVSIHDAQLLSDIDLYVLGRSESKFDEYERQVRKEYEWVPQKIFVSERSVILKSFLSRPSIYLTPFFRSKYENRARENLSRSLVKLSSHP